MSVRDNAFDFISRCRAQPSLDALYADFEAVVRSFGFEWFVLTGVPTIGQKVDAVIAKTTYPSEWSARYRDEHLEFSDPVALMTLTSTRPFSWSEAITRFGGNPQCGQFLGAAAEVGLRDGFATPMFDASSFQAVVGLAAERKVQLDHEREAALVMMSTYFKMAAEDLGGSPVPTPMPITPREREVLSWAAAGKTRWEVSEILGVSEETVKKHLAAICRKLDVGSTTHAVTKAIRHRLIAP